MLRIPFNPSVSADQTVSVLTPEQLVMTLRLVWSERAKAWDIFVSSDNGELGMFRITERFPILYEHRVISPIKGDIIVLPLSEGKGKPLSDYDALGDSWGLFYINENDLKAWEKANGLG